MTEITNSAAPAAESALSHPLTLDDAMALNFEDPSEDNNEEEPAPQSETATGEAEESQEPEEIQAEDEAAEGDEEDADASNPDEPTDDVHVTVNGEKVALSALKAGYMRQADYSRKTQEVASRRRDLEALSARVTGSVNVIADFLAKQVPPAPDPQLAMTNPGEYVQKKAIHDAALEQVNTLLSQAGEVKEVVGTLSAEQRSELIATENAKLTEIFPQTRTNDGRKAFFETAAATAKSLGYSDEEIGQAMDHRLFALAHYAAKGMQAEKAQEKAKVKTQNTPPVAPQKARPQNGNLAAARRNQEAKKRLARTGSIDDAMDIDWA